VLLEALNAFLPDVEQTHREDHAGEKGYMGTIVIFCESRTSLTGGIYVHMRIKDIVDGWPKWLTAKTIYDSHLPHYPVERRPHWFFSLKYALDKGLVFRECNPYRHTHCKPGIMEKEGSKWVWKEKSLEQLEAYDISLTQKKL